MDDAKAQQQVGSVGLPPTAHKILLFQIFNSVNFTIALGAPMVLTARYLGASEFHVGLLNALGPGLVALQIITASLVDRIGYRELMLLGWGARSLMLLLIVPLPLLVGVMEPQTLVWLMVLFIFLFNMIRGLTAGAWLPWMKVMLPPERRGYFFGLEQWLIAISGFTTLILAGLFLGEDPSAWRYSMLFVLSWAGGMMSVYFLRQTPPTVRREGEAAAAKVSPLEIFRASRAIWSYAPFQRMAVFAGAHALALSAVPVFLILFLREEFGWSEGVVLKLQSMMTVGTVLTALLWGRLADRVGSRPLIRLALLGQVILVGFWLVCATGQLTPTVLFVGAINLFWGICMAAQSIPQTRLVLDAAVPEKVTMSMAHFQVVTALCGACSPLFFGLLLMLLREDFPVNGTGYSIPFLFLFGLCLAMGLGAQLMLSRIRESKALRTRELLIQVATDWPVRVLQIVKLPAKR